MKKKITYLLFLFIVTAIFSEEITVDENEIFGNSEVIVDKKESSKSVDEELNLKKISFSGDISYEGSSRARAAWIRPSEFSGYESKTTANLYLDVRVTDGIKVFGDLEGSYYPKGKVSYKTLDYEENGVDKSITYKEELNSELLIKEFFFDTNYKRKAYFRFGKQNLKWGKSYFWNPIDTINIERRSFLDMDRVREGVYGVKTHIPFGVEKNIYFFVNNEGAEDLTDNGISAKYEFMVKNSEMSFSLWSRKNRKPVAGYDLSFNAFNTDFRLETAASYGSDLKKLDENRAAEESQSGKEISETLYKKQQDKIFPKVTAGFTKYFDYGEFKDRISFTGEFYYNSEGYSKNIIKLFKNDDNRIEYVAKYYEPNNYGRFYAAFFTEFSKFMNDSRKSIHLNVISNISDRSGICTAGFKYNPIDDFTIEADGNLYAGQEYSEYMISGNRASADLKLSLKF